MSKGGVRKWKMNESRIYRGAEGRRHTAIRGLYKSENIRGLASVSPFRCMESDTEI